MSNSHYPLSGEPVVFIDFATTGLCPKRDLIIELGAVRHIPGAGPHPELTQLIDINRGLPRFVAERTGINDGMLLASGRRMNEVLDEFLAFAGDHPVVSFNINHDAAFLNAALARHGRPALRNQGRCALAAARTAWPALPDHRLGSLARHLGLEQAAGERALDHARLARDIWFHALQALPEDQLDRIAGKPLDGGAPAPIPRIDGPGTFRFEVVGTRRYQDVFERLCGPRTPKGAALDIPVQLRVDPDSNAVRVLLHEQLVGNLGPRAALDFRRWLAGGKLAGQTHLECAASIRGGTVQTSQEDGNYVMWVDLPGREA